MRLKTIKVIDVRERIVNLGENSQFKIKDLFPEQINYAEVNKIITEMWYQNDITCQNPDLISKLRIYTTTSKFWVKWDKYQKTKDLPKATKKALSRQAKPDKFKLAWSPIFPEMFKIPEFKELSKYKHAKSW